MKLILGLFFISFSSFALSPHYDYTRTLKEKGSELSFGASYFKTQKRMNKDAKDIPMKDGESFTKMTGSVSYNYGLSDFFELGLYSSFIKNDATFYSAVSNQNINAASSGPGFWGINLKYALPFKSSFKWAIEGSYANSFFSNVEYDNKDEEKMILGDDGQVVSLGIDMSYLTSSNNFVSTRALFRNPGKDLSSEIFLQGELALNFSYVSFFAGGEGNFSLKGDPYDGSPEKKPNLNKGGSALYNSTNREWIAGFVGGGLRLGDKWRVEVIGKKYLQGRSTDLGDELLVSLVRRSEKEDGYKSYDNSFKEYRVEASIDKVAKNKKGVIINKGLADGVTKGMKFDFYIDNYLGGNILVASGYVIKLSSSKSIIQITNLYTKDEITEKLMARGGVIKN